MCEITDECIHRENTEHCSNVIDLIERLAERRTRRGNGKWERKIRGQLMYMHMQTSYVCRYISSVNVHVAELQTESWLPNI